MKVLNSLFPFASSWTPVDSPTTIVPLAGGAFSFASPARKNGMALPAGSNIIQVTRDLAMTGSPYPGLVAFVNKKPLPGENLIHFDLDYRPTLRLGNVGQQSLRLPTLIYDPTVLQVVHVLWHGNSSSWIRVGNIYNLTGHTSVGVASPILNTAPACPTANLSYQGRFVRTEPSQPDPDLVSWYQALANVEAGLQPRNTVGIALAAVITPVRVVNQNAIASTDFSLTGPITLTSPNFVGLRDYGGTPFPGITIALTSAYDATDTAVF